MTIEILNQSKHQAVWLTSSGIDPRMGGIASVTRSCLSALAEPAESGLKVTRFIGLQSEHAPADDSRNRELEFRPCRDSRIRFLLETAAQIFRRPAWIIYEHVDLAQCQVVLPRSLRSRYAVWGHGIELWRELPRRKEQALGEADLLLFNSSFTREKAATFHPWILDCPFRVIPLCREEQRDDEIETVPVATGERRPDIITVGRLVEDRPKGHLEILEAMPEILSVSPETHWHIVGDGPWRSDLQERINGSGVQDHITMHGFVNDLELNRLYQSSRVFAMPSRGEGFGLVYAEAMSHGLPCVGSISDAAPEVIADSGFCVDLDQGDELGDKLIETLTAPQEVYAEMSDRAISRAQFFTLPRFAEDLRDALEEGRE